jgi:hypothetical protein
MSLQMLYTTYPGTGSQSVNTPHTLRQGSEDQHKTLIDCAGLYNIKHSKELDTHIV